MARNQTLSFGLVSIEVSVDKAVKDAQKDVALKMATEDHQPVSQVYQDEHGDTYARDELVKGVFTGDEFHEIPKDALDAIAEDTKGNGVLELAFEPVEKLRLDYATGIHFVKAKAGYEDKLALLAQAMEAEGVAAVTTYVPTSRQSLAAIYVKDGVLYLVQLPFASQIKDAPEAARVDQADVPKKHLAMARKLVKAAKGNVSTKATDEAVERKAVLIQEAVDGKKIESPKKADQPKKADVSLEAALEASLAAA